MREEVKEVIARARKSFVANHFSWSFLKSIFTVKELLPLDEHDGTTIEREKALIWFIAWSFYTAIFMGVITALAMTDIYHILSRAVNANIIPLTVFLIAVEPVYFSFMMCFTKYRKLDITYFDPDKIDTTTATEQAPTILGQDRENAQEIDCDVSVLISCHNSANAIDATLEQWTNVHGLKSNCIFVMDNADDKATDDTQKKVEEFNKKNKMSVQYAFVNRGNKTYALYRGALLAKTSKVIICDDDIIPPQQILSAAESIKDKYKYLVFPLIAINKGDHGQVIRAWQNLEYALADHAKMFEDTSCGPTRPHGACSMWDREYMLQVLESKHDTRFMGEDLKMGVITTQNGERGKFAHGYYVKTYVPNSYFGKMGNYYTQRVRVWEMGRHIYTPLMLWNLCFTWLKGHGLLRTIRDNAVLKTEQTYFLYLNFADWIRLPVFILSLHNWQYWVTSAGCYGLLLATTLVWNYIKLHHHPERQHHFFTIISYPIYKIIYKILSIEALARALFVFIPNYQQLIRIDQLELQRKHQSIISSCVQQYGPIVHGTDLIQHFMLKDDTVVPTNLLGQTYVTETVADVFRLPMITTDVYQTQMFPADAEVPTRDLIYTL